MVSDVIIPEDNNTDGEVDGYYADVVSATDYSAFGVALYGRSWSGNDYRYGFNGKEKDDEVKGAGAQYDYGFRIYDSRLGRFLSIDPLTKDYPWFTPYQFAGNTPIQAVDIDGLENAHYMLIWIDPMNGKGPQVNYGFSPDKNDPDAPTQYFVTVHNIKTGESTTLEVTRKQFYEVSDVYDASEQLPDRSFGDWLSDQFEEGSNDKSEKKKFTFEHDDDVRHFFEMPRNENETEGTVGTGKGKSPSDAIPITELAPGDTGIQRKKDDLPGEYDIPVIRDTTKPGQVKFLFNVPDEKLKGKPYVKD